MDPRSRRSTPPPHPAGYPVIEDAPVHLAPAVDVREGVRKAREALLDDGRSRSWPLLPAAAEPAPSEPASASLPASATAPGSHEEVLYTLAFPVEERRSNLPPPPVAPPAAPPAARVLATSDAWEELGESPRTLAFGVRPHPLPSTPPEPPSPESEPEPFEPAPRTLAFERARPLAGPAPAAPLPAPIDAPPRTIAFEPEREPTFDAAPRTVAFERGPARASSPFPAFTPAIAPVAPPIEDAPRTVAFEPRRDVAPIVARAPVVLGAPSAAPAVLAGPRPAPSDDAPPSSERAPDSAMPPSAWQAPSVAPTPIPAALAPLIAAAQADGERAAIARDLASIGALDERPDRDVVRDIGARATLARARALRLRLSILDAFDAAIVPAALDTALLGPPPIDLSLDAALVIGLADGAPFRKEADQGADLPFVRALVAFLRAGRPDLPRSVVRDRGAAAIARITITGYRASVDEIARAARETTHDGRLSALDAAAVAALAPAANAHRLAALGDLERALALPTGSVAQALELAQRRAGAPRP